MPEAVTLKDEDEHELGKLEILERTDRCGQHAPCDRRVTVGGSGLSGDADGGGGGGTCSGPGHKGPHGVGKCRVGRARSEVHYDSLRRDEEVPRSLEDLHFKSRSKDFAKGLWSSLSEYEAEDRKTKNESFTMYERNGRPSNFGVDVMTPYHKGRLKKLRDTIVRYVSPDPVADHLVEKEVLPQAMAGQIKQIEEPELANERMLDILPNRPDHAFDHFCDGVRPEHPWLSDLLEEEEPEMTDNHRSRLEHYRKPLAAYVDPHPVINHMKINEYFNPMEAKDIASIPSKEEANNVVIDLVKDRPDPAFYHYLACVGEQDPNLAAELGGPDYQKDMKLHLANGNGTRAPRMFTDGQYDGDLSGKDTRGLLRETGSDMPMLNNVDELKVSNMVAVEPVEMKMSSMDHVDAPNLSSGIDSNKDLHKSDSQILDPNRLGRASGPMTGSGFVMPAEEEMDMDPPEVHPFEAQSGSTIEVENSQPVIIEIIGDAKRVRWLYEGASLPNNDFYRQTTEGEEFHSLFIAEVTRQNQGCYTCEGTTESGVVNCDIFIKVREPQSQLV
ncbi:Hypp291 [Branchiostoma lanceolatum]|uniref:Hypp291 protein n=1 Tax=Branchiostoma lanceolatum TaxID=7740 RepID=A0A8J9VTV0_BRALA|nr:Hypp291 [Branchiostoma lanceolatum]